jgi:hypothetical protein
MPARLWFRLDDVLALAEHAMVCTAWRLTGAQALALGPTGPALTWTRTDTDDLLHSTGLPGWHNPDGTPHAATAYTLRHTATGRRVTSIPPTYERAYLPLGAVDKGQPSLIDLLRAGRHQFLPWVAIDLDGSALLGARHVRVFDHRDDVAPDQVRWTPAMVTCTPVLHHAYPALIAAGFTTDSGDLVARFDRPTVARIADDLHDLRVLGDAMPGEYPALRFDGDTLLIEEEHDDPDEVFLQIADRCYPDPDGFYPLAAYLWPWQVDPSTRMPLRTRLRLHLTAATARRRRPGPGDVNEPSASATLTTTEDR